jgi:hypothetical protein
VWAVQRFEDSKTLGWRAFLALPQHSIPWIIEAVFIFIVWMVTLLGIVYQDGLDHEKNVAVLQQNVATLKSEVESLSGVIRDLDEARDTIRFLQEANAKLEAEKQDIKDRIAGEAVRPRLRITHGTLEQVNGYDRVLINYYNYGRGIAKEIASTLTYVLNGKENQLLEAPPALELPPGGSLAIQVVSGPPSFYERIMSGEYKLECKVIQSYKDERGHKFKNEWYGYFDPIAKGFTSGNTGFRLAS